MHCSRPFFSIISLSLSLSCSCCLYLLLQPRSCFCHCSSPPPSSFLSSFLFPLTLRLVVRPHLFPASLYPVALCYLPLCFLCVYVSVCDCVCVCVCGSVCVCVCLLPLPLPRFLAVSSFPFTVCVTCTSPPSYSTPLLLGAAWLTHPAHVGSIPGRLHPPPLPSVGSHHAAATSPGPYSSEDGRKLASGGGRSALSDDGDDCPFETGPAMRKPLNEDEQLRRSVQCVFEVKDGVMVRRGSGRMRSSGCGVRAY